MTILFLSRLFHPHFGGVEKHVLEVSTRLIKRGHKVIVVTEQYNNGLKKREKIKEINVYRIPILQNNWFKKFFIWLWLLHNRKLIEKADIVHCHDVFFWYLPFKFLYPYKAVYTTFHGYEDYPIKKRAISTRKLSEVLSKGNICIGAFIKKWYYTNPTYILYGGVSTVPKRNTHKKQASALFWGRLDAQTSALEYAKAYRKIKEHIKTFDFTIIGDGIDKQNIETYAQVLGYKNNPESFVGQYRFAFVSRYLSILEAMMAKRLVFALYDNPLKKDYLTMTPFARYIVIASSPAQLAKKVEYYLQHPTEERKRVNAAFAWVKNQSWDSVVKTYLALWNR